MKPEIKELKECLFASDGELQRCHQILVNCVLATNRYDTKLMTIQCQSWERLFGTNTALYDTIATF
jgi:hypothetical protein